MEKRVVRDAKFILTVATSQGEELARFDVTSIGGDIIRLMAEKGEGNGFVCGGPDIPGESEEDE